MKKEKKKAASPWKKTALIVLCAVLGLLLLLMILGTVYYEAILDRINRPEELPTLSSDEIQQMLDDIAQEATGTGPMIDEEDVTMNTVPVETIKKLDTINILLVGQDARPGDKRYRSDAMILCTIKPQDNTVIMTSFLRDMYVKIPGIKSKQKLNAAYMFGGMELLRDTMMENFGIEVDNIVEVNFNGFMEIVDIMGGVEIELTKAEANHLNRRGNWGVTKEDDWSLVEGPNLLTGSQALAYSRIRYIGTDFERVERQKRVLTEMVDKVRHLSLTEINNLVMTFASLITTDMTNSEITGYVIDLFPMLLDLNIVSQRIPLDKTYRDENVKGVGAVLVIDFEKNLEFLKQTLGDE